MAKKLTSMNKDELIAFASEKYAVDIDKANYTRNQVLDMITDWEDGAPVTTGSDQAQDDLTNDPDQIPSVDLNQSDSQAPKESDGEERKTIIIHESEDDDSETFWKGGVNGKAYQIKRGEEVSVPASVVEVLDKAVITKFYKDENGNERQRDVLRFPYSVVS